MTTSRPVQLWGLVAALALGGCNTTQLKTTDPGVTVDTFSQVPHGKIDVLWVVDDSPSMADKQTNLANNFSQFFDILTEAKVDYHIGVLTTDVVNQGGMLQGKQPIITNATTNPVGVFQSNVHVGATGNPLDEGLDAVRLFFQSPDPNFLRKDAFLYIIMVSDKDDVSQPGDAHFFYRLFSFLKGAGNNNMVKVSSIVGAKCTGAACDATAGCFNPVGMWEAQPAPRYGAVSGLMNGLTFSICDATFAQSLKQLGINALGLQTTYPLTFTPDEATLKVTVTYPCPVSGSLVWCDGGTSVAGPFSTCSGTVGCLSQTQASSPTTAGWVYNTGANAIIFQGDAIPPKGASIQVQYKVKGAVR